MEAAFGITAWDYTGRWLSIDGRTSGQFMFFWGLIGVVGQVVFTATAGSD